MSDTEADAAGANEGLGVGESGQGMDAGANVPDSGIDGGSGREAYRSNTAAVIDATMQHAKDMEQSRENFDPMGSAHKGTHSYYGGIDMDSMFGQPTGTKQAFTDAQYKDKGWVPGKALTYTDEYGKTQLARLDEHEQSRPQAYYDRLREEAYAAKAAQPGINTPFGKVSNQQIAQQAMAMMGGPVASLGMGALSAISVPYDARVSGTAAERAALGYHGPGYPTGLPNIGPHMKDVDRNWDDARWSDNYSPDRFNLGQTVDHQGNKMNAPTSPAGGEVITVEAPAGAPDQRVTQFKAMYPTDWTETLTDEEILEMVENPDQLRFWLSWRQT